MAETVQPLLSVLVDRHCEVCEQGLMRPVKKPGALRSVSAAPTAAGFPHTCTQCGTLATYRVSYPEMKYVDFMAFIRDSKQVLDDLKQQGSQ